MAEQFSLLPVQPELAEGERAPFLTREKVWVYQYIVLATILFCAVWFFIDRNRWYWWSVVGSAAILLVTYFQVQISVFLNEWYRDFYDLIQAALQEPGSVSVGDYYAKLKTVLYILVPNIFFLVIFHYFNQHYIFRWRTAMNDYYTEHWPKLRLVEGAAQRVQEDTMRFARIVESLGSAFISSVMTLIAFMPVLWNLSKEITELPIVGAVSGSLVFLAIISAAFGTVVLALVGIKLPGLEFNNQKVEAAFRKELVYGEDSAERATPMSLKELFSGVRKNYFKLYFHYMYFNIFFYGYNQGASFIPFVALGPTVAAGAITFGLFSQIMQAFGKVENSFQFLVNSWTTIIDLMSIHKRLIAFESIIHSDTSSQNEGDVALSA